MTTVSFYRFSQTLLVLAALVLGPLPAAGQEPGPSAQEKRFLTKAGAPLPFAGDEELLRFMATAKETSSEFLSTGVTKPKRLVLERDGIKVRAVFHYVDREAQETKLLSNGRRVQYFRDSYRNQVAAYVVARLLGLDNVPPTLLRSSDGQVGSAQFWVENSMMDVERRERGLEPAQPARYVQQYYEMRVFDNVINNIDRNQTNILFDTDWNLWMIDHTRTFGRDKALPFPEMIKRCSRTLWDALGRLDDKEVRTALKPFLGVYEVSAVISRAHKVRKLLQKRMVELGEEPVLFTRGVGSETSIDDVETLPVYTEEG